MYNTNFIREALQPYIKKNCKFVIYPFGGNGLEVKRCLREFFGIEPFIIVDNELCKYNSNIISFKQLEAENKDDLYIILTIDNPDLNMQMEREIKRKISGNYLINLRKILNSKKELDKRNEKKEEIEEEMFPIADQRVYLDNFLPHKSKVSFDKKCKLKNKINEKIKVRILHSVSTTWNAINTICEAFMEDLMYDVLVIVSQSENIERKTEQLNKKKIEYIILDAYHIEEDCPDILILSHPYEKEYLGNCRKYVKLIVVANCCLKRYEDNINETIGIYNKAFARYKPDYYLFDQLLYDELKEKFTGKIIKMGNAKFDGIYKSYLNKKCPKEWEDRVKGKKIILWTTTHGLYPNPCGYSRFNNKVTFDKYAKDFFEYAVDNSEVAIILRLHKRLIDEFFSNGFWTENDLIQLREYCEESCNIIFDETESYDTAYSLADAIITDWSCGISISALPLNKPIGLTFRNSKIEMDYPEIEDAYYKICNSEQLISFINMIVDGKDSKYEVREGICKKCIMNFDGRNGKRIKEFISEKYAHYNSNIIFSEELQDKHEKEL